MCVFEGMVSEMMRGENVSSLLSLYCAYRYGWQFNPDSMNSNSTRIGEYFLDSYLIQWIIGNVLILLNSTRNQPKPNPKYAFILYRYKCRTFRFFFLIQYDIYISQYWHNTHTHTHVCVCVCVCNINHFII